jgi:hypothetical protein
MRSAQACFAGVSHEAREELCVLRHVVFRRSF